MVPEEERVAKVKDFLKRYKWKGPVFEISALTGEGCEQLCFAIQTYLDEQRQARDDAEEHAADVRFSSTDSDEEND